MHYNISTVSLCATKATVWEYSHAVFLQKGQMYMRTKRIIAKCEQYSGYGAGAGDTEYYEYECPCGKGTIIEEHDNIPGFREHSVIFTALHVAKSISLILLPEQETGKSCERR